MMPHSNPANAGVGKEGSQSVKLVLGYEWSKREQKLREEGFKGWFTEAQWQELYLQALIFKYFQSGHPVPLHLVPPIWRSSVSRQRSGLMDGEPWRCRRTDGKRWRCRKRAVPNQKYCEPHMHRGKNRSRKLVETAAPYSHSKSNSDVHSPIKHEEMFTKMPLNPYPKFLSSTATKNTCGDSKPSIASPFATQESNCFCTNSIEQHNSLMSFHGVGVDLNSDIPPVRPAGYLMRVKFNNMNTTATRINQPHIFTPQLDGVTPNKCVLQHDAESQRRCMRSDGKKWQCKRPTFGEHKYCEMHLHRGSSKKRKMMMMMRTASSSTNPVTVALPPPQPPLAIATRYIYNKNDDDDDGCTSLDTKLSVAPFSHLRELKCDSPTHTRSSGDSTTITDDETMATYFVR